MNPLTPIDVCNSALQQIANGYQINSFDDQDAPSRACRQFYPQCRRMFLGYTEHDFSFATTRQTLVPISGKNNWYQLPSNMVRTISIDGSERREYYIEGDQIYTEIANPVLIYIKDDNQLKWFPADAVESLIFYLASKLALAIKQDANLSNALLNKAEAYARKTAKADIRNLRIDKIPESASEIQGAR
ncbi:MAG: hypothetical protein [Bacteriophage sp.]|nr:MAG: hypothetical protein [Bacteriophage sp.]